MRHLLASLASSLVLGLLATTASAQLAFIESGGMVSIEAENFTGSAAGTGAAASKTWNAVTVSGSSGGARQALTNSGVNTNDTLIGPRLDYRVKFATAGTYQMWVRLRGANANDNAIHVGYNGSARTLGSAGMSTNTTYNSWVWKKLKENGQAVTASVSAAGYGTVNIWMREDGVVIDKIVLTTSTTYNPQNVSSGLGPAQSTRETHTPATGLASSAITSSSFTLTWNAATGTAPFTTYDVLRNGAVIGSTPAATRTFNVTGLSPSTQYSMTVQAKDAAGFAYAASSAHLVTTSANVNQPPTATLTAPPAGARFTVPGSVNLTATASDPNGAATITKVEFFDGATKLGEDLTSPYAFSWSATTPGFAILTAKATDNQGRHRHVALRHDRTSSRPAVHGRL